ncbi:MAG: PKD-like family lipoprotein [Odoribacter sp.]
MRRKIYTLFPLFMLIFAMCSCFDDKGNYNYTRIGEAIVTIPGVTENADRYVCEQDGFLKLDPQIKYDAGTSESDYAFMWIKYLQNPYDEATSGYFPADTISEKKLLEYQVKDDPNLFYIVLKVINKQTDVETNYRFEFVVTSVNGWLVLDENAAGEGDLHIIRDADITIDMPTGKEGVTKNYFSLKNKGAKIADGQFIGGRERNTKALFVFTTTGTYWIDKGTYTMVPDYSYTNLFDVAPSVFLPEAQYYSMLNGGNEVMINDGAIYSAWWNMWGTTGYGKSSLEGASHIAPMIASVASTNYGATSVMYDVIGHRFVTIGVFGDLATPSSSGAFNVGEMEADLELVYLGEGIDGSTCAIFDKKTEGSEDEPYLYRASFTSEDPVAADKINLSKLTDIKDAKFYTFGTRGNMMYYATDSKIYCYRFGKENSTEFLTSLEAGEKIVKMKLYVDSQNAKFNGKILFVATNKGDVGKVYKIKFNEMTGLMMSEPEVFDGFGIIKDMFNKN